MRTGVVTKTETYVDDDWQIDSETTTTYLNDKSNFTGYPQVFEEVTRDANGDIVSTTVYAIGLMVIGQTTFNAEHPDGLTLLFAQDGHGSVRLLLSISGGVVEVYSYDAYGNAIGFDPAEMQAKLGYNTEQFDALTNLFYFTARYEDPRIARFTTLDPFAGDSFNPLSFNKYLFAGSDGINFTDPTGWEVLASQMTVSSTQSNNLAAKAFAAYNVWDKADTFKDAIGIIARLATGGSVGAVEIVALFISVFPFSKVLRGAKIIKGGVFLNATGKTGVLGGVAKHLDDTYKAMKKSGDTVLNRASEVIGELGAAAVAKKMGFKTVPGFPKRYHGIDALYRDAKGRLVIVEAKGGGNTLGSINYASGAANAGSNTAQQMSKAWIEKKVQRLRALADTDPKLLPIVEEMEQQIMNGKIQAMVVTTKISADGATSAPAYILKKWDEVGAIWFDDVVKSGI